MTGSYVRMRWWFGRLMESRQGLQIHIDAFNEGSSGWGGRGVVSVVAVVS